MKPNTPCIPIAELRDRAAKVRPVGADAGRDILILGPGPLDADRITRTTRIGRETL